AATKENFELRELPVGEPGDGEVLIKTVYLSVDPYMRGRMSAGRSYAEPAKTGEVMLGGTIGKIVQSRFDGLDAGDVVLCGNGWQSYATLKGENLKKLDLPPELLPAALGVLGMPGLTAWYGLLEIGKPKSGQTVVVSGAAGAVGSAVGQIAKIHGCRAVGIAGTDEKLRWLTEELGFDAALNYRTSPDLAAEVAAACPQGVDVYFDNVGGEVSTSVLRTLNTFGRIAVCGQISTYNQAAPEPTAPILPLLLTRRAMARGFIVGDHAEHFARALGDLRKWVENGRVKHRETIIDGIEHAPDAFLGLFRGDNIGKQLVRVGEL
ncbi:MAG TPA: NADP-dependent oxidoreductase, partial [Spirochaetia bacterium]|nr:NADP-dependent oxidoreductase [Spirochaetia bacterium]